MIGHRCKNCLWWDHDHTRVRQAPVVPGIPHPGLCRKHKPGAYALGNVHVGVQPIMDAEDFCGEFREDIKEISDGLPDGS